MKFGVNTLIWSESFGPEQFRLLPAIQAAGFDGIEIPLFDPHDVPARAIRDELKRFGLACTAVSIIPSGLSLASLDAAVRVKAREQVEQCVHVAAELGVEVLAGPLYSPVGFFTGSRRTTDEWKYAVEAWRGIAECVDEHGVQIAIEPLNRFETYFLNTIADAVAFCDAIGHPNVGLLLDTFHANIEEKTIGAAVRSAARHLKHIHTCENDRGTPGSGHVDWREFFAAVGDTGYNGWMTIESFGFSLGAVSAAASIWRDLASTPGAIAFEGLPFLRKGVTESVGTR